MKLNIYDKRKLAQEARHIQGSLSTLLALEKTDLSVFRIREIVNDIHSKTDNFLKTLDEIETPSQ